MKSLLAALGAVEEPEEEESLDDDAQQEATLTLAGRGVPASKVKPEHGSVAAASAARSSAGSSVKSKATTVITEAALEKLAVKEAVFIDFDFFPS